MKNIISALFVLILSGSLYGQCPANVNDPGVVGFGSIDLHRVECAWELTHGSPDVIVAVVDVFSSQLHEDLQGKIVSIDEIEPMDAQWLECHHGVSVAGTIAAIPNNGIAVAGVGYDTRVALYNVGNSCGGGWPGGGFNAAVNDGHNIINLSWQGNPITRTAAQNFVNSGGVIITAGGDNHHTDYSDIPGVINVGVLEWTQGIGWNHHNYLDQDVDENIEIYGYAFELMRLAEFDTWIPSGGGSSSTAPIVAGAVALIRAENPALTPAEIECIIKLSGSGFVAEAPADAYARILDVEAAVLLAQSWPNIPLGEEIVLSGTQTISNVSASGNVVIKTGSEITVTDNITMLHPEGRVIVERGARLNVFGATVGTGDCNDEWRGFVVEGNANRVQPHPYGPLQDDDAGVLLLNSAQIFNARNAVSMHNKHQSPTLDYTGGIVIANNGTTFIDNGRSFEFMRYSLGDASTITNCFFINNSKNVITAWRDHGLQFSDNTFLDYEQDGIFNATSVFDATGNTFNGSGSIGSIDFQYANTGININNAAFVNDNYKIEGNAFTENHHAIKFEGTDNNLDGAPSLFSDNVVDGNDFGIFGQGSDFFDIRNNLVSSESSGIIVFNSGTSESEVRQNDIAGGFSGLNVVNQNDLFTFYRNCFQNMPNTSQANDFELIRVEGAVISIAPLQAVLESGTVYAPDNCFQALSDDIVNGAPTTNPNSDKYIPPGIFNYGKDPSLAPSDCRVAKPNILYLDEYLPSIDPGCDPTAPPGNPTSFTPVYCNVPTGKTDLQNERNDLQTQISGLEALPNPTFTQLHLLRKLKRCLGKVEAKLGEVLIDEQSLTELNMSIGQSHLPFVRVAVTSELINREQYTAAQNFMNSVPDVSDIWLDYVASQEILIRLLSDFDNFSLQGFEESLLIDSGKKSNYYAAFIRGVYAEVTGESIYVDYIVDRADSRKLNGTQIETNELEGQDNASVSISPNPSTDEITIFNAGKEIRNISIISANGNVVVKAVDGIDDISARVDISMLPKGLYIVLIESTTGEIASEKLIKL